MTVQPWEPRLTQLETRYEHVDKSLDEIHAALRSMDARLDGFNSRFDTLRGTLDAKIDSSTRTLDVKIDGNFRWTIATMVALFAALGAFVHFVH